VATVDAADGYVFVQRFVHEPGKAYPDNSSVEFWMNGLGAFYAWGKLNPMDEDPKKNPYVFESEVLSPFALLNRNETATYRYEWAAARIQPHLPVVACTDAGVTCLPPSVTRRGDRAAVAGSFGVFARASAKLVFLDMKGQPLVSDFALVTVSPDVPFDLSKCSPWQDIECPASAAKLLIVLVDSQGKTLGELR